MQLSAFMTTIEKQAIHFDFYSVTTVNDHLLEYLNSVN